VPDLITGKELDQSRDAVSRAAAEVKTKWDEVAKAKTQLAMAQANYEETLLRAPIDGVVSRIHLRVGATAKAAETPILDFLTLDRLYIEVALPLPYLRLVHTGMPANILVEDEHRAIKTSTVGHVRYIYPEIDSTTRMFRV
jgi:multidrug resistance efflux pump